MSGGKACEVGGKCALGKLTYAVAYPRAVVIKFGDASIAHSAVFRSDGLPYLWSTGRKMSVLCAMETAMQIRPLGYPPASVRGEWKSHNYQTGAAEYAEIQRACLCQLNYSLNRGKKRKM